MTNLGAGLALVALFGAGVALAQASNTVLSRRLTMAAVIGRTMLLDTATPQ
jgi:hypothetical protein